MYKRTILSLAVALSTLVASAQASAQVTFALTAVTIPTGTNIVDGIEYPGGTPGAVIGNLDNYVCQDLTISTTDDWHAAAMLVELTNGSIYQETEGFVATANGFKMYNGQTSQQPSSSLFSMLPSSEYDTHIHANGHNASTAGAGGDAGGDTQQFDSSELDVSWFGPTDSTDDTGTVALGRFTFTNNATGIWRAVVTVDDGESSLVVTGTISNGVMQFDP